MDFKGFKQMRVAILNDTAVQFLKRVLEGERC